MNQSKVNIGIIGCGNISGIYFQNCFHFEILSVVACADLVPERAQVKAAEYPGVVAYSVDELLKHPEIEIVLNLTTPNAHFEVGKAVLEAGKNLYNEKPLTIRREEGQQLLALAAQKGLKIGCAPDTFLGAGQQTCRKLIDDGWIGKPVAATAFMLCHGHESWHPDPEFYYQSGGGPMFDMGPYYLTSLIHLLGPVKQVAGLTKISFPERLITSEPKKGTRVQVEVPTHIAGLIEFASGAVATIVTSFDVWAAEVPCIEIYGTEGSLSVPDPNCFGGPVRIYRPGTNAWKEMPLTHIYAENSRGIGIADLAYALRFGRAFRANAELAFHVLDVMHAFHEAFEKQSMLTLSSTCQQPAPLPLGLRHFILDK